jgi:hypothetical protein
MKAYKLKVTVLKPFCDDYCYVYLNLPKDVEYKDVEDMAKEEALKIFNNEYDKKDLSVWLVK